MRIGSFTRIAGDLMGTEQPATVESDEAEVWVLDHHRREILTLTHAQAVALAEMLMSAANRTYP